MLQAVAGRLRESLHGAGLIEDVVLDLVCSRSQAATAEADQVREGDVRPDPDAVVERERDGSPHHMRIATVEAAGDVRRRQMRHQRLVVAERPASVGLAHVGVEIDLRRHRGHDYRAPAISM